MKFRKHHRYSKDFICSQLKYINFKLKELKQMCSNYKSLIVEQKKLLKNTDVSHEQLWNLRLKIEHVQDEIIRLKKMSNYFNSLLNEHYNPHNKKS